MADMALPGSSGGGFPRPGGTAVVPRAGRWRGAGFWLVRRIGSAVFVLWAVATLIFLAIRLIPGDPAEAIMGGPGSQASAAALEAARAEYGLDEPLWVQYLSQLGRLATGDLGTDRKSVV